MEKELKIATVVFPVTVRKDNVWLARKTRFIGKGCWNGYGGGKEKIDKSIRACAVRELYDECKIKANPEDLVKVAIVWAHNTKLDGTPNEYPVHIYILYTDQIPEESEEMETPTLFSTNNLPLDEMMLADKDWVPRVLNGEKLLVNVYYDKEQKALTRTTGVIPVNSIE